MGKTLRKISSVAVSTITVISLSGASLLIPAVASAQTIESLLAEITRLTALLNQLQVAQTGGAAVVSGACSFTRDLTVGAKGDDVKCLQSYLTGTGHFTFSGGATGYFGGVTKTAVAAWQAANAVSPAAGYFGAKSKAKYSAVAGGAAPAAPGQPVVVPGAGLSVMAAASQPTTSAIAGAGQIDVLRFIATAAATGGVTINEMKFSRTGVISDSNISNLYLADEGQGGRIVAQYSSLSGGVAVFGGVNQTINAGQSKTYMLRMDLSSSATAGNTLGWRVDSITTAGAGPVSGLPVTGPTLNVTSVSNPSVATISHSMVNGPKTVDAGTNGFLAMSSTVSVTNSPVLLKNVKYTLVGSADKPAHLKNFKLRMNGKEIASVATVEGDFLLFVPTEVTRVNTGSSVFEVLADVTGSPNRTFEVQLLRPYDLVGTDTTYNVNITASLTDDDSTTALGDVVTINQGRITVSKSTDSPTGNVPNGASAVTLGKYTFYAGGEPVRIRFIDLALVQSGGNTWATIGNVTADVANIRIIDDVGGQVGSNIAAVAFGSGNGQCTDTSATQITCHFGTSSSTISYIVPANTTRVLTAVSDIVSTNDNTTIRADLPAMTGSNLEGQISFQTSNSGAVTGNRLTIVSSPLTVAINTAVGTQTYVAGAQNVLVASFTLAASSAEGIKVSSMTFDKDSTTGIALQNLKVMVGGTQFGTTTAILSTTAAETSLSFSGANPVIVPAGGSVKIDVFADILNSTTAADYAALIDQVDGNAVGATSNSSITWPTTDPNGQQVSIVAAPTLTLAASSDNPASKYMTMSSADNELFKLRLTVDNTEDVRVTDITFRDTVTDGGGNPTGTVADRFSLTSLKLVDDQGNVLAGPVSLTARSGGSTSATIIFALGNASPLIIPKNTSKVVTVKSDIVSFTAGAVSDQVHTIAINTVADVTSVGKDSSATVTVSGAPIGNGQTVYRSRPALSTSVLGAVSNRIRASVDEIALLNWTAQAYDMIIGTVALRFGGAAMSAAAGTSVITFDTRLIDSQTNNDWGSAPAGYASTRTCTTAFVGGASCGVTFQPLALVSGGTTKAVKLRVDSSSFQNTSQQQDGVSVTATVAGGLRWSDGGTQNSTGVSDNVSWESVQIPITVLNIAYE